MFKRFSFFALFIAIFLSSAAAESKYIFYFIGDGMGPTHVLSAQTYLRQALNSDRQLSMTRLPVNSFVVTYSASSPVTDSAAAGTALSTGHKTRNGMLGMDADTIAVTSAAKILHDNGYGVAILTTVPADDATPGAFYAHVPNRSMFYEIGRDAADSDYELIAGSSLRGTIGKDGQPTDLIPYLESKGVAMVGSTDELLASDSRRAILIPESSVWGWNMGYAVDAVEGAPTLADMTSAAISHLMKHTPERFFIMAEGGTIDHAGHANDAGTVIKEVLAFDEAIERAIDFYVEHPDETLIVITADHETGGMSIGNNTTGYNAFTQYFEPQKTSKERFSKYCDQLIAEGKTITWPEMKQYLSDNIGLYTMIPVDDARDARIQEAFRKTFLEGDVERQETLYADINHFPVEVFNMLNDIAGIGWTTGGHSGSVVPLYVAGSGAKLFIGQNDNTAIPEKILKAAGLNQ